MSSGVSTFKEKITIPFFSSTHQFVCNHNQASQHFPSFCEQIHEGDIIQVNEPHKFWLAQGKGQPTTVSPSSTQQHLPLLGLTDLAMHVFMNSTLVVAPVEYLFNSSSTPIAEVELVPLFVSFRGLVDTTAVAAAINSRCSARLRATTSCQEDFPFILSLNEFLHKVVGPVFQSALAHPFCSLERRIRVQAHKISYLPTYLPRILGVQLTSTSPTTRSPPLAPLFFDTVVGATWAALQHC